MGKSRLKPQGLHTLDRIMGAIEDTKMTLSQEIGKDSTELGLLCTNHHKLSNRVMYAEAVLADLQSSHQDVKTEITQLPEHIQKLESRAEDADGRNRGNNVHIVGLPEAVEGTDVVAFLKPWLQLIMDMQPLTLFFALKECTMSQPAPEH
ncbi:hypothetical protein NDU88_001488 [Pleurodeles waltl]|uniref:Uncharacterized protein n=1 Tax=Pleurodeles waltl TaxID=8319 RepID=A0AAV7MQ20_PLEWA|nr:hypothetical protein NDU88_001488 [Pleurodeles waltl]